MKNKLLLFAALLLAPSLTFAQADPLVDAMRSLQHLKMSAVGIPMSGIFPSLKGDQKELIKVIRKVQPGTVEIGVRATLRGPSSLLNPNPLAQLFGMPPGAVGGDDDPPAVKQAGDLGSGFIVGKDDQGRPLIVTNAHVVDVMGRNGKAFLAAGKTKVAVDVLSATMTVITSDGKPHSASLIDYSDKDSGYDLALVRLNAPCPDCAVLKLGDSDKVAAGEFVIAFGAPLGLGNTVTFGIVSNPTRQGDGLIGSRIQTDAPINPGNSGGPLVDISGKVIGVNEEIATLNGGSMGLGFAVPISYVKTMIQRYKQSGIVNSSHLGIEIAPVGDGTLRIVSVSAYAASQGLEAGDIVVSVDDRTFSSPLELAQYLSNKIPGEQAVFELSRNARPVTVTVVLQAMQ